MHASRCLIYHLAVIIHDHVLCVMVLSIQRPNNEKNVYLHTSAYTIMWECIKSARISSENFFRVVMVYIYIKSMYSLLLYNNEYYTRKSFITKCLLSKLKAMMTSSTNNSIGIECCCSF